MTALSKKKKKRKSIKRLDVSSSDDFTGNQGDPKPEAELLVRPDFDWWVRKFLPVSCLVLGTMAWAFWPTFTWVVNQWNVEPDYSHGYLVVPLALMILFHRQMLFPGVRTKLSYGGLWLIALSLLMRFVGRVVYADFLDAWSVLPMVAGAVWFFLGWRTTKWAFPAILFLLFMFPLPYQAETMLSWKLQGVATGLSTVFLRVLGQPAVAESHVIWLLDERLVVEQACSGLRIFIGVAAAAFFWAAVTDRHWMDQVVVLLAFIPVALLVNALRITLIGLLYVSYSDESVRHWAHDVSGLVMIPTAFALLWLVKVYWQNLYRPVRRVTAGDMLPAEIS